MYGGMCGGTTWIRELGLGLICLTLIRLCGRNGVCSSCPWQNIMVTLKLCSVPLTLATKDFGSESVLRGSYSSPQQQSRQYHDEIRLWDQLSSK